MDAGQVQHTGLSSEKKGSPFYCPYVNRVPLKADRPVAGPSLCVLQGSSKGKELPHSHTIYIPVVFGIACDQLNPDGTILTELTYCPSKEEFPSATLLLPGISISL